MMGFPGGSDSRGSACNVGDPSSTAALRRFPKEGNGHPLHYSWLDSSTDREAWWATIHGVSKESDMTK